jgi:hypothetical protein
MSKVVPRKMTENEMHKVILNYRDAYEVLRAENKNLKAVAQEVVEALKNRLACIDAAEIEGLSAVIDNSSDEELKDLLVRRVFWDIEKDRDALAKWEAVNT